MALHFHYCQLYEGVKNYAGGLSISSCVNVSFVFRVDKIPKIFGKELALTQ